MKSENPKIKKCCGYEMKLTDEECVLIDDYEGWESIAGKRVCSSCYTTAQALADDGLFDLEKGKLSNGKPG